MLSGVAQSVQELLEAEAASHKPIEDEIDEERRKVDAKTPITEEASIPSHHGTLSGCTLAAYYAASTSLVGTYCKRWSCTTPVPHVPRCLHSGRRSAIVLMSSGMR